MSSRVPAAPRSVTRPANFDRLAGIYRWLEWFSFGPWLSRARRTFLYRLADRRCALLLGDGDGRFTAALLRINPNVEVDAVDASRAMLDALMRRAGGSQARVRTQLADARRWRPAKERRYDLVATHFFLDCLTTEEVRRLAVAVRPVLAPGALWVVSEFAIPDNHAGRLLARPIVAVLYWAFGRLTGLRVRRLPDHRGALQDAGFRVVGRRSFLRGLLAGEVWAVGGPTMKPQPGCYKYVKINRVKELAT
ncbi:MAG TPA: class I SAM-dependent methyltransferase [Terracidiphilus sp.]